MRVLISNDDGINAQGIIALANILASKYEVMVVAPNRERSAASHSLSINQPLYVEKVSFPANVTTAFSVSGTPSDCVKLALSQLLPNQPDLVVSGINNGPNMGVDIYYSGTVAAAMEGVFSGIPSLAVSFAAFDTKYDLTKYADYILEAASLCLKQKDAGSRLYNLNLPNLPADQCKGLALTKIGKTGYSDAFAPGVDKDGKNCFYLKGRQVIRDESSEMDIIAVRAGHVSLSPIDLERTDFRHLQALLENGTHR